MSDNPPKKSDHGTRIIPEGVTQSWGFKSAIGIIADCYQRIHRCNTSAIVTMKRCIPVADQRTGGKWGSPGIQQFIQMFSLGNVRTILNASFATHPCRICRRVNDRCNCAAENASFRHSRNPFSSARFPEFGGHFQVQSRLFCTVNGILVYIIPFYLHALLVPCQCKIDRSGFISPCRCCLVVFPVNPPATAV